MIFNILIPCLLGIVLLQSIAIITQESLLLTLNELANLLNPALYLFMLTIFFAGKNLEIIFKPKKIFHARYEMEQTISASEMFAFETKEPIYKEFGVTTK